MNPLTLENGDVLRDATSDDLTVVVAIYNASIPARLATADTSPVSVESRREWFDSHEVDRRPLWVVERAGEVIAWLSLRSFYGRPAYHATVEVSLYLAPQCQGGGLGTRMLQALIERCPAMGVRNLIGFVFAHNAPSLRMNEKVGFEQWGLLPSVAELDGVWRDLLIVGRKIE